MEPLGTVAEKLKLSEPVNDRSTAAAEKVECPLMYSANDGVGRNGRHLVPRISTRLPWFGAQARMVSFSMIQRTAVIARIELKARLASQATMLASSSALLRAKNSLASWPRVWPRRRATSWAIRFQWPGGVTLPGPSAQYQACALVRSSSDLSRSGSG